MTNPAYYGNTTQIDQYHSSFRSYDCCKMTATAISITAFIVGVGGLLIYCGPLFVGLSGVGTISQAASFYMMISGLGTFFLSVLLIGMSSCYQKNRDI
jgi:hypothetical protein